MKYILAVVLSVATLPLGFAQGPKQIAKADRSLWPYETTSIAGFDYASKMEMLVFVEVLKGLEHALTEDSLRHYLAMEKVAASSVQAWQKNVQKILLDNFKLLSKQAATQHVKIPTNASWEDLAQVTSRLDEQIPEPLQAWLRNARAFYSSYIYEQVRLAALFPRITSEILPLEQSEITGFDFKDKEFLLTFDDGPTAPNGHTDKLIATLHQQNINGIFFILGDMLQARLKAESVQKIQDLYGANVLSSHGKTHKSHQRYKDWQNSLSYTFDLIDSVVPENAKRQYFRPPYGQRNQQLIAFLAQHKAAVMLWNIDTQDWNAKISATEVADRTITLMLLWRKGILLFHDIHPKARTALPIVWSKFSDAGIKWVDPRELHR